MRLFIGVTEFLSNLFPQTVVDLFEVITSLGEQYFIIAFIGLFYWCIDKNKGQFIALCAASSLCINNFFKNIFRVERPFDVSDKVSVTRRETATGHSFPSGHTQNAATAAFSAAHGSRKAWSYAAAAVYTLLIALSRLVLGVHYITDVAGGILFAFVSIAIVSGMQKLADIKGDRCYLILCVMPALSVASVFINGAQSKDALTSAGISLGVIVGVVLEKKYIGFTVSGGVIRRAVRFVVGFAVIILLLALLKLVLPSGAVFRIIRYFIIGVTAAAGLPLVFKKTNL